MTCWSRDAEHRTVRCTAFSLRHVAERQQRRPMMAGAHNPTDADVQQTAGQAPCRQLPPRCRFSRQIKRVRLEPFSLIQVHSDGVPSRRDQARGRSAYPAIRARSLAPVSARRRPSVPVSDWRTPGGEPVSPDAPASRVDRFTTGSPRQSRNRMSLYERKEL